MSWVIRIVTIVFLWMLIFWGIWLWRFQYRSSDNKHQGREELIEVTWDQGQKFLMAGQWDEFERWAKKIPSHVWHQNHWQEGLKNYAELLRQAGYLEEAQAIEESLLTSHGAR